MSDIPLWQMSAVQLAAAFKHGTSTATAVLFAIQQRLDEVNEALNAVVTLNPNAAAEAAESDRRIAAGTARSTLEGVPVTIKDNLLAQGMAATWGSRVHANFIPTHDELPVRRLRAAGAVVIGKTNVPEFTVEGYTHNAVFGTTRNPWDLRLTPGGSSGGAVAAVAAGIAPIALGTDGGGSIRRPAAHAGLVGLKPTLGRVARQDGFPRILLDMEVVGPICRCVADVRLTMEILAAADTRDQRSLLATSSPRRSARSLRVLYVPHFGKEPVDAEIATSVSAATAVLTNLGHAVHTAELPFCIAAINAAWPIIGQVGVSRYVQSLGANDTQLGPTARQMAEAGAAIHARDFAAVIETLEDFRAQVAIAFREFDLLVTPTNAALPWPAEQAFAQSIDGQTVGPRGHAVFSGWVNACGHPAITLPCATSASGLPIGMQLVAGFANDDLLLDVAQGYEAAAPWAHRWPDLDTYARTKAPTD